MKINFLADCKKLEDCAPCRPWSLASGPEWKHLRSDQVRILPRKDWGAQGFAFPAEASRFYRGLHQCCQARSLSFCRHYAQQHRKCWRHQNYLPSGPRDPRCFLAPWNGCISMAIEHSNPLHWLQSIARCPGSHEQENEIAAVLEHLGLAENICLVTIRSKSGGCQTCVWQLQWLGYLAQHLFLKNSKQGKKASPSTARVKVAFRKHFVPLSPESPGSPGKVLVFVGKGKFQLGMGGTGQGELEQKIKRTKHLNKCLGRNGFVALSWDLDQTKAWILQSNLRQQHQPEAPHTQGIFIIRPLPYHWPHWLYTC